MSSPSIFWTNKSSGWKENRTSQLYYLQKVESLDRFFCGEEVIVDLEPSIFRVLTWILSFCTPEGAI